MGKLALVFAGQGSQYAGMGIDYLSDPKIKELAIQAQEILGYDVEKMLNSDDGTINQTIYTQPLVFLASAFAYEAFKSLNITFDGTTGFSLGEYTALYASGIFDFKTILDIIKMRAQWMNECATKHEGMMAAIIGLDRESVDKACMEASDMGIVVSANYNSPVQVVISGEKNAVAKAMDIAKSMGAKRAIPLNVNGAFHSPLMKSAGDKLQLYLKCVEADYPQKDIYMNATGKKLDFKDLKHLMEMQIQSSVYFEQTINEMVKDGYTHFVEIGPGTVLSGLIKKIDINLNVTHLDHYYELEALKGWLETHGFDK